MSRPLDEKGIIVPYEKISKEALQGLLEDFVSRDGTDSGYTKLTLQQRADQVRRQLERGEAVIVFDLQAKTANIVSMKDLPDKGRGF